MKNPIAQLKQDLAVRELPYLQELHAGTLAREDFVETQIQFLFAVVFFSRPMAALAGRVSRPEDRVAILDNIADEHGHGRLRFSHEATFLQLLGRLGVTAADIERRALWPEVRAFNTALAGLCLLDDVPTALAALGMIEDLFAVISARIGSGIVARGWLAPGEVVHYATHEKLDEEHAAGFYRPLESCVLPAPPRPLPDRTGTASRSPPAGQSLRPAVGPPQPALAARRRRPAQPVRRLAPRAQRVRGQTLAAFESQQLRQRPCLEGTSPGR